jgi:DNA-binding GntR family transcriptional regulator
MNAKAAIAGFNTSEKERSLLEIPSKVPCLMIKMLDHDQNGVPVMTAECIYRSDLYELQIDVSATLSTLTNRRVS